MTNSSTVTREAFKAEKITTTTSTTPKEEAEEEDSLHQMLEPHLRPVPPSPNSQYSKKIFEDHKQLAKRYLKVNTPQIRISGHLYLIIISYRMQVQTEIAYVNQSREKLLAALDPIQRREREELCRKLEEYVCCIDE